MTQSQSTYSSKGSLTAQAISILLCHAIMRTLEWLRDLFLTVLRKAFAWKTEKQHCVKHKIEKKIFIELEYHYSFQKYLNTAQAMF